MIFLLLALASAPQLPVVVLGAKAGDDANVDTVVKALQRRTDAKRAPSTTTCALGDDACVLGALTAANATLAFHVVTLPASNVSDEKFAFVDIYDKAGRAEHKRSPIDHLGTIDDSSPRLGSAINLLRPAFFGQLPRDDAGHIYAGVELRKDGAFLQGETTRVPNRVIPKHKLVIRFPTLEDNRAYARAWPKNADAFILGDAEPYLIMEEVGAEHHLYFVPFIDDRERDAMLLTALSLYRK